MAQRVALRLAAVISNFFIAASERNRLEAQEADGLGIIQGELNDAPHLLVINSVDDRSDGNNVYAVFMQVVNGAQLYVKQITDLAVRVRGVTDAIKLQIGVPQTSFSGLAAELRRLREFNSVRRGLH